MSRPKVAFRRHSSSFQSQIIPVIGLVLTQSIPLHLRAIPHHPADSNHLSCDRYRRFRRAQNILDDRLAYAGARSSSRTPSCLTVGVLRRWVFHSFLSFSHKRDVLQLWRGWLVV